MDLIIPQSLLTCSICLYMTLHDFQRLPYAASQPYSHSNTSAVIRECVKHCLVVLVVHHSVYFLDWKETHS